MYIILFIIKSVIYIYYYVYVEADILSSFTAAGNRISLDINIPSLKISGKSRTLSPFEGNIDKKIIQPWKLSENQMISEASYKEDPSLELFRIYLSNVENASGESASTSIASLTVSSSPVEMNQEFIQLENYLQKLLNEIHSGVQCKNNEDSGMQITNFQPEDGVSLKSIVSNYLGSVPNLSIHSYLDQVSSSQYLPTGQTITTQLDIYSSCNSWSFEKASPKLALKFDIPLAAFAFESSSNLYFESTDKTLFENDIDGSLPHNHFVATMMLGPLRETDEELAALAYASYFMDRFYKTSSLKSVLKTANPTPQEVREVKGLFTLIFYFSYCKTKSNGCSTFIPKVNLPDIVRSIQNDALRDAILEWYVAFTKSKQYLDKRPLLRNLYSLLVEKLNVNQQTNFSKIFLLNIKSMFRTVFSKHNSKDDCLRYVGEHSKYSTFINYNIISAGCSCQLTDALAPVVKFNNLLWIVVELSNQGVDKYASELLPKFTDSFPVASNNIINENIRYRLFQKINRVSKFTFEIPISDDRDQEEYQTIIDSLSVVKDEDSDSQSVNKRKSSFGDDSESDDASEENMDEASMNRSKRVKGNEDETIVEEMDQ
jgi:hypothetical protein